MEMHEYIWTPIAILYSENKCCKSRYVGAAQVEIFTLSEDNINTIRSYIKTLKGKLEIV